MHQIAQIWTYILRNIFLENSNKNTSKHALLQPGNRKCRFHDCAKQNSGEGWGSLRPDVLVVLGEEVDDPGQTRQGGSLRLGLRGIDARLNTIGLSK